MSAARKLQFRFSGLLYNWGAHPSHQDPLPFFWNKHSRDCCKPLVKFQSSVNVDLDVFCQCSCFFCRGAGLVVHCSIFQAVDPSLCIFEIHLQCTRSVFIFISVQHSIVWTYDPLFIYASASIHLSFFEGMCLLFSWINTSE